MSTQSISISTKSIIKILIILLAITFIFLIKDVLALLFVAIILSSAFDPLVDWLQNKKIPRALSIILVYIIFIGFIGAAIYMLTIPIADQIKDMSKSFPDVYTRMNEGLQGLYGDGSISKTEAVTTNFSDITKSLTQATASAFNFVSSLFGGVISFFMVLVMTFYLTVHEKGMKEFIQSVTPSKHKKYVSDIISKIQHRLGYWLRGQLLLSLIIFCLTFIGLKILGVKYALILALIAGIFEIVPFLGPIISAIPGIFFAFTIQGFGTAIWVVLLYFIIQQLENNLIVPKVMGKSTGLNPLVVILSILVGARLGGIIGALLAVPVATAISVYVESSINGKKTKV